MKPPDVEAARKYDDWYATPQGSWMVRSEEALLGELLGLFGPVNTALEAGCGTGHFTRWLSSQGMETTGLDLSAAMIAVARERSPNVHYIQGVAEALPFAEGAFDVAVLITSLEFVADQERALIEAARVARRGLLLGVLNLASPLGLYRKALSRFRPSRYRRARFFTPWGLERWIRRLLGNRVERIAVRTTLWPRIVPLRSSRLPFGAFIGAVVIFSNGDKGGDDLSLGGDKLAELRRKEQRVAALRLGARGFDANGGPRRGLCTLG